jgi:type I restriction-modification system DNA methylase subunit
MNIEQARALVEETFPKAFDKARFHRFVKEMLNGFNEEKAQQMAVPNAFAEHVRSCIRLGTYESPEHELVDVLVVKTTEEWKLERTRSALRDFVAHKLKRGDNEKDAGLVAFVSPTERQWRFSYVKMEYAAVETNPGRVGVETRLTPARRLSYIVGEGESCHTAQSRFLALLQDTENSPTLAQLEDAFSVEAVTNEFFKQYAALFGDIDAALQKLASKNALIRNEFNSKRISNVDFAKKLMGQIVFLYFLQKKGWLGVAKGQDWGTGPHDFLRRLARGSHGAYENFFNDVLEPLFYDTLATDRGHEAWCNRFKCRIPFLNGGLFEPLGNYDWKKADIVLPDKLFTNTERTEAGDTGTGILDVFDRYNFTVNEAEPLEKEVAIDPEMLGKVFENLIEENRRKGLGSYYTPREIVHYMCQESLINYLDTAVNKEKETVSRADLETFVHLGDQISHYEAVETRYAIKMPKSIEQHARPIDEKLADITICDPAVGSGAFPVGMMTEIVRARSALTPYFNDFHDRTPYHFKRHAIQNCLYGVDIDPGAVEIAKLRLWLSLVVDEESAKQIKPLPNLDYKVVPGNSLFGVEKTLFNEKLFRRLEELKPKYFEEAQSDRKVTYKSEIDRLIHNLTKGKELFDFHIYFSEVFHKNGGFDVVIANPPYVFTRGSDFTDEFKKLVKKTYFSGEGKINLFCLFLERGSQILTLGGVYAYIIPNTFFRATSYEIARELIVTQHKIMSIVDLHSGVFEHVTASTTVIMVQKSTSINSAIKFIAELPEIGRPNGTSVLDQSRFDNRGFIFSIYLNDISQKVIDKVTIGKTELQHLCLDIIEGIVTPKGKNNFIFNSRKTNKHKPFLDGKDIGRYRIDWKNRYILFDRDVLHRARPDYVWKSAKKILIRRIGGGATAIFATLDTDGYYTFASINNLLLKPNAPIGYEFTLGLLNSTLLNWFYVEKFTNRSELTVNISRTYLDQLPIAFPKPPEEKALVTLVKKILEAKREKSDADTKALERAIDAIVYRLYDLTPEEIAVVEQVIERN